MKKGFLFALLIIIFCFAGCSDLKDLDTVQSSEPSQTTEISPDTTPEISAGAAIEQPINETSSDENDSIDMEVSGINFSEPGVYEITYNTIYSIDVNSDGVMESLSINNMIEDHNVLTFNDINYDFTIHTDIYGMNIYIVRNENKNVGILISHNGTENCYSTCTYVFNDVNPVQNDYIGCGTEDLAMHSLTLVGIEYIFGSWRAYKDCILNDEFKLIYDNDSFFKLDGCATGNYLDTKKDIPVQILEDGVYLDAMLPAGSQIYPTYAGYVDDQRCMIFETEDGITGRLFAEYNENGLCINGINEYDIFDNILYVGS